MPAFVLPRFRTVPVLVGLAVFAATLILGPSASAYTIDQTVPGKLLFTSDRLHDNTVRATVTMALFENGNYEYRADVHNSARLNKVYEATGQVYLPGMGIVAQYNTGEHDISRKSGDNWDTLYVRGNSPQLKALFAHAMDAPPQARFHLSAAWRNGGVQKPSSWCGSDSEGAAYYTNVCLGQHGEK